MCTDDRIENSRNGIWSVSDSKGFFVQFPFWFSIGLLIDEVLGLWVRLLQVFYGAPVTCPKIPVRSEDFNYPTFSATYAQSVKPVTVRFTRTATNVGPGTTAYTAVVKAPVGVKIVVSPTVLQFSKDVRRRSFTLTVSRTYHSFSSQHLKNECH